MEAAVVSGASAAAIAKGALRRLAVSQLEPTPANYARAWAEESGQPVPGTGTQLQDLPTADVKPTGALWAALIERLAKNLDRGGKQWTTARRKDSLKRVFDSSRSDADKLLQRLQGLMTAWESDHPDDPSQRVAEEAEAGAVVSPAPTVANSGAARSEAYAPVLDSLTTTLRAGLPADHAGTLELADRLHSIGQLLASDGVSPERILEIDAVCRQARRVFGQRHQLVEALASLCRDLGSGLIDLAEEGSWAQGQCEMLQSHLSGGAAEDDDTAPQAGSRVAGMSVRGVRAASAVLAQARQQQKRVREDRQAARDALKQLIQNMLEEVGELGEQTGRFEVATAQHAQAIERADTVDGLAEVVKAMLADARAINQVVTSSQERLHSDHLRATELEGKVQELESELRRLSDEVSTDALTQVANRRGLMQSFEIERARAERAGGGSDADAGTSSPGSVAGGKMGLAVALIDIDNFKKLNDTLGHAAGDQALKNLAAAVRERLRPVDHLARFGGEEFVVLLPGTEVQEAQQALTRLQRSLSEALFLHDGREVFVTFSAGVTQWRSGESLEASLERADDALYEAKRTGKNRTCIG